VASADAKALVPVRLQDADVAIATLSPGEALGPSAAGPLRYRVVQGEVAGDWQPLATLVRLPALTAAKCTAAGCILSGRDLFLIGGSGNATVPAGYTDETLALPPAPGGTLALRMRDDPAITATIAAGTS
jgi:hypothetical protein